MLGDRLSTLVDFESLKLAAGAVLLSPFLPLLFMGEEYGETAPFLYFIDHSDPDLVQAVREGRKEEFGAFGWREEPLDPQSEETFARCRLIQCRHESGRHKALHAFYGELIQLRKSVPALANLSKQDVEVTVFEAEQVILMRRRSGESEALAVFNFSAEAQVLPLPAEAWRKVLDSAEERWEGAGSGEGLGARSVTLFVR
jgi:maltooligosyltrehalose trehalohydrolase